MDEYWPVNPAHNKKEIKTEVGEINRSLAGFVCPKCQSHFLCSDFFVEHVREHHSNTNLDLDNDSVSTYCTQIFRLLTRKR